MNTLNNIREYITLLDDANLKSYIRNLPLTTLLEFWDDLSSEEELKIFSLLNTEEKVDLIASLSPGQQEKLIRQISDEHVKVLLEQMEPDDLTDFIQSVSPEARNSVWNNLSEEAKKETRFLLRYDEDDAAGLMTPNYLAIRSNITVASAISFVRQHASEVETVYNIYIIDQLKRLIGVISLRELLVSPDTVLIEDVMEKNVISVLENTDQEEAAKILETYDFLALPVTDSYHRLLGIITFDDVMDVIREEQTEDIYKMGAMDGSTDRYLESSIWNLIKKRIPWLTILLIAATFTTNVLSAFEGLMASSIVLTLFIPTIIGTGGNSGTQSSTLMIRGLATRQIHYHDFWRIIGKEFLIASIIGLSMGVLIILRSVLLPPFVTIEEAAAVGIALCFVIIVATLVGATAPLMIHRLGFDPTVMAGPLMATIIDLSGLTIYFLSAKLILGL
ncbi:MAG: magnesium transporter [Spirochaetales bacterium]|nr:magnesium transporter [Spirochaetales bacterium]